MHAHTHRHAHAHTLQRGLLLFWMYAWVFEGRASFWLPGFQIDKRILTDTVTSLPRRSITEKSNQQPLSVEREEDTIYSQVHKGSDQHLLAALRIDWKLGATQSVRACREGLTGQRSSTVGVIKA